MELTNAEICDNFLKEAEAYFKETGVKEDVAPYVHILSESGDHHVAVLPELPEELKDSLVPITREITKETKAVAVCFIIEAWGAKPPKGVESQDDLPDGWRASTAYNREEILLVRVDTTTSRMMATYPIYKDTEGKRHLGDCTRMAVGGEASVEGRLAGNMMHPSLLAN